MKRLPTALALAGLAGLSLGLPAHHATLPARAAAGLSADAGRAHTAPAAHAAAPQPVKRPPARAASTPKPAEKTAPRGDGAGAAEGLMVGPDGVIYRREAAAR